jgi:hypothetical protein
LENWRTEVTPVSSASRQQGVVEAVRQWQTRLLQLDRRNALLYFAKGKRSVPIRGIEPHTLLEQLAASRSGLAFAYAERVRAGNGEVFDVPPAADDEALEPQVRVRPGDLDTDLAPLDLQKRLGALSKRNREWQEEQGLNVLFIAVGFLRWVDEDQEPACSPILLVPCDLARESPRDPYLLVSEDSDDPVVNPTLRHKLGTATGITLPEFGEETVVEYLATVEGLVSGRPNWSVETSTVLATFPFSKLAMWEDLDLMASTGVTHPLVRRLAGDADARVEEPTDRSVAIPRDDVRLQGAKLDDLLDIRDQHTVLDADFSQLRAIELARSGANLVIHGPPGTGKSQTIANIVATLLAEGRRILFVSEKTAALDVVKRRLTEVGLGGFCLDLHSDRGRKASVYAQLRAALDQPPAESQEFPYARLVARRDELNAIVRALHQVREPLGLSVFAVHGRVAAIGDVPRLSIIIPDVAALEDNRLLRIQDAVSRIARRATEFRQHHTSRWRSLGPIAPSPRLADAVWNDLAQIRSAVDATVHTVGIAATMCGVVAPTTLPEVARLVRLLAHLKNAPGAVPPHWLEPGGVERGRDCADSFRPEAAARRSALDALGASIGGAPPGPRSREWLGTVCAVAAEGSRWDRTVGPRWSSGMLTDPRSSATQWHGIAKALDAFVCASRDLQTSLGITQPVDTREAADAAVALASRLQGIGTVPASWSSVEAVLAVGAEVAIGRHLRDELVGMEHALAELFGFEIIEQVDDDMLVRYRTDYRSFWRSLRPTYRRDHRALRGCLRRPGKLSLDEATMAIERALAVKELRSRWSQMAPRVLDLVGDRFRGIDSDWASIDSVLDAVACIYRQHPTQVSTLQSVLLTPEALTRVQESSGTVQDRSTAADALWPDGAARRAEHIPEMSSDARAFAEAAGKVGDVVDALGPFVKRPIDLDSLIELLQVGARLREIEERAAAASESRARAIGAFFSGWSTDFNALDVILDWTRELLTLTQCPPPEGLSEQVTRPRPTEAFATEETAVTDKVVALRAACAAAAVRFPEARLPWASWDCVSFDVARAWCEDLSAHAEEASDWVEYRSTIEALDDAVGVKVADALRTATGDSGLAPDTVLRHVYMSWLEYVYHAVPALQFAPKDLERVLGEFRELDAHFPRAARERVRAKCLAALDGTSNSHGMGELGVLGHQLSLRKRQMPVRKLVARIPNLLQKLKPCFMMSPLAVSQYLPRGATDSDTLSFDTVIFDEASQVFPEDAVPAVARGRQAIVVGDQQQLPPTTFFRSDDADDDYDVDDENGETVDNRLVGVESILDVLVGMRGAGVDDVYLQVHYRSQHDALIRYSNHYFYDDRLLTFPSALGTRPGLGIRSVYLPDGRFEAGGSRTNRLEAEQVVHIAFELMQTQPRTESIGVVALSRAQADLIQQLIDTRRLSDRRFDDRFAEDAHERFFVKNLENVQGDERDHVILSVGYGPTTASGTVPNRFGPVNIEGGHRRLNVAVSRARRSMTVVHSLRPEDIHSEVRGAKLLRRYLEFLRSGEASIEGAVRLSASGDAESPFEDAVGRALTQRGYRIQRQVGCAKYSIDMAVLSEDGSGFDLGIECDGAAYHRSPSARDRDRIRQEILERIGWRGRIHRVWSTAWIRNPRAELDIIERAIRNARAMPREAETRVAPTCEAPAWGENTARQAGGVERARTVTSAAEQPLFATYTEADARWFPRGADVRQETAARIAELVAAVVNVEGPVHVDVVVERVRRYYRLQRAGRRVRDAVLAGIKEALRRRTVTWLTVTDSTWRRTEFLVTSVDCEFEPRGALQDGTMRHIDHLCDREIEAGVIRVVRAMVGASKDEVVTATARAFGYARTGQHVEGRMATAVDRLLATHGLVERVGSLVLPD